MTDARLTAWLDQDDQRLAATIRRHGFAVEFVDADACGPGCPVHAAQPAAAAAAPDAAALDPKAPQLPWRTLAYSVGFFGLGHPELLLTDIDPGLATVVLCELFDAVVEGDDLLPGQERAVPGTSHRWFVEEVPNPGDIAFAANRHYRRPAEVSVPMFQLTRDDEAGRFPWEVGCSAPTCHQPRPGTFTA